MCTGDYLCLCRYQDKVGDYWKKYDEADIARQSAATLLGDWFLYSLSTYALWRYLFSECLDPSSVNLPIPHLANCVGHLLLKRTVHAVSYPSLSEIAFNIPAFPLST